MGLELLLALGVPILLVVSGTLYFAARGQVPQVLKRLTSRDAIVRMGLWEEDCCEVRSTKG